MTASSVAQHLSAAIEGNPVEFNGENLSKMTNLGKIKKIYKLGDSRPKQGGGNPGATNGFNEEQERTELEILAIGLMALRGQT